VTLTGTSLIDGVDLSAMTTGTLVSGATTARRIIFKNCKLHASTVIAAAPDSAASGETIVAISDSSGLNYRHEKYHYSGTQTVETTIVRSTGASDGTTPIAWKIITTANSELFFPFETLPMAIWNDTIGSVNLTVYGIGAAVPTTAEVWMEANYMGSAATPVASFINTGPATVLTSGAAGTSDTSIWGGSTAPFKLTTSFTANLKGWIYVTVKVAKASSTFYIDPKPVLS
jgi:hypothetical protein